MRLLRYACLLSTCAALLGLAACGSSKSELDGQRQLTAGSSGPDAQPLAAGEMPPFPADEAQSGSATIGDNGAERNVSFRPSFFDVFVEDPMWYWGGAADWADPHCFWLFSDPHSPSFSWAVWRCEVKDWFPQQAGRTFNLQDCFPTSLNFDVFSPWQFDGTCVVGVANFRYHRWDWFGPMNPPEAQVDFWDGSPMTPEWGHYLNDAYISDTGRFYFCVLTNGSSLKICNPVLHCSFFDVFFEF